MFRKTDEASASLEDFVEVRQVGNLQQRLVHQGGFGWEEKPLKGGEQHVLWREQRQQPVNFYQV